MITFDTLVLSRKNITGLSEQKATERGLYLTLVQLVVLLSAQASLHNFQSWTAQMVHACSRLATQ